MQNRPSSMPINIEKPPRSALLRGVRITEFKDHVINPDPIILQETDFLLEEFLSPTKLKALTGVDDLYAVDNLEMVVDTSETSLGNFGIYLPNLQQLKLNSSYVPRIRDLGTSLVHLRILWLTRSSLFDLDGIPTLHSLEELYLAYNEVTDISPCSMLENLKVLDLEGNLIDDIRQVEFLSLCNNLKNLTLEGNPVCIKPYEEAEESKKYRYRHEVIKILQNIKTLDNIKINRDDKSINESTYTRENLDKIDKKDTTNNQCHFDDDWDLINQWIEEGIGPPEEKLAINEAKRPDTASSHCSLRPLSAMRPLSSCKPGSALKRRPMSGSCSKFQNAENRSPNSRNLNSSSTRPYSDPVNEISNDASKLTVGPALQGNPLKGLLARRKLNNKNDSFENNQETRRTTKKGSKNVPSNYSPKEENTELLVELDSWRKDHEKKMQERKKYFEPQVLKIEDNVEPLSSEENENSDDSDQNYEDDEKYATSNYNKNLKSHEKKELFDNSNRISSASSYTPPFNKYENDSGSRATTGDTGYTSVSDASLSSLSSVSNLNNIKLSNPNLMSASKHQPVIVSASGGVNSSKTNKLAPNLKQLKNNFTSLSGLKYSNTKSSSNDNKN